MAGIVSEDLIKKMDDGGMTRYEQKFTSEELLKV